MVDIVLRAGKGSPLTNAELDANFTNLKIAVEASSGSATWAAITDKPTTLAGYGITDAQALLTSGTNIKTFNGQSVLASGNIQFVESFNGRLGAIALSIGDVTTALGYTPANKAGDTFTGNVLVSSGAVGVNTTFLNNYLFRIGGNISGGTTRGAGEINVTAQADVTSEARGLVSTVSTAASSFTLGQASSFFAAQGTIGAGSTISTQVGFLVSSNLIGGTNNYGFRGAIPSGSNRFNLYMDGTADNYLAGNTGIGASPASNARLRVVGSGASSEVARIEGGTLDAQHIINQTDDPTVNTARAQLSLRKNNIIGGTISIDGASGNRGIVYYDAYSATGSHAFYVNSSDRLRINSVGAVSFSGAYGSLNQVLTSQTSTGVPTWQSLKTINGQSLLGAGDLAVSDAVYSIADGASVDINPVNGGIQVWALGANRTPTATNFAAGQSVTLMIADGTAFAVTWSTIGVVWVGGTPPTLPTTGYGVIELWKVGSTVYGAYVGAVA